MSWSHRSATSRLVNRTCCGGGDENPKPISEGQTRWTGRVSGVYFEARCWKRGMNSRNEPGPFSSGGHLDRTIRTRPAVGHDDRNGVFLLAEKGHEVDSVLVIVGRERGGVVRERVEFILTITPGYVSSGAGTDLQSCATSRFAAYHSHLKSTQKRLSVYWHRRLVTSDSPIIPSLPLC
jgi:hypothetical protein